MRSARFGLKEVGGLALGEKALAYAKEDTMHREEHLTDSAIAIFCDDLLGFLDLI